MGFRWCVHTLCWAGLGWAELECAQHPLETAHNIYISNIQTAYIRLTVERSKSHQDTHIGERKVTLWSLNTSELS